LRNWLDTFAYSTDLSIWVFAVSALLSLLIAVITVMTKAIGTANSNTVEALKYE
jgi:putative ABC transport system permease protein